ncbi:large ribosomal subunit protein uL29m [Bos taurus]|uniref:Large ribosomal subunit protein uL29m n=1 Tax=Bos taurus TaxID=9913 RepID=RM47_BOVIN|nr:large ribosomal subunit protein uL29m [Bos taurus]Q08DT6.1 RecName: Full=Large ribosomal subunit protein uL29m; AltName: Full=39S ribosomal protein L47, mitochondrial; Short=L47mt; Short=MRP-L47; Flags: Precursor [Bos taurus]AAI23573.1 Mitochondrial ribosomal protein L47 [Bos taurus]
MAAASLAVFCRRVSAALKASTSLISSQTLASTGCRFSLSLLTKNTPNVTSFHQCRLLQTTLSRRGLEEFFDDPKNWGEEKVKSGASWTCQQLRNKSNEDLHKLWYVLLKERNMLLTLEQEAKRQRLPMPSPERLEKVVDSMDALDKVVQEREDALRLLQTGQEKPRPGAWRRDIFGRIIWHKFKQWPIPWYLNKRYNRKRFFAMPYVERFVRLRIEKQARIKARKISLTQKKEKFLQKKFPHLSEAQKSSAA